eukprot:scaffold323227_cov48-Prasinocladus_malaysianus.AAC.1
MNAKRPEQGLTTNFLQATLISSPAKGAFGIMPICKEKIRVSMQMRPKRTKHSTAEIQSSNTYILKTAGHAGALPGRTPSRPSPPQVLLLHHISPRAYPKLHYLGRCALRRSRWLPTVTRATSWPQGAMAGIVGPGWCCR